MKGALIVAALAFVLVVSPVLAVDAEKAHGLNASNRSAEAENRSVEAQNNTPEVERPVERGNVISQTVHALLAVENRTGGIGKNISVIAREFNNSIQTRLQLEDRISNRSAIMKFLFGGDRAAAGELDRELNSTDVEIQKLQRLRGQCNCTSDVAAQLQTQITAMQQEQARLRNISQMAKADKGLFGWLFG